jgi:hypothetical protein
MWRAMFSSTTMASSTTKPVAMVSAISDRLSRLKPARYMTAKVPASDTGTATLGMSVARAVAQEQEHHQDHQPHGDHQRALDLAQRGADGGCAVHHHVQVDGRGIDARSSGSRRAPDHRFDDVGAGLLEHHQQHRRLAVGQP